MCKEKETRPEQSVETTGRPLIIGIGASAGGWKRCSSSLAACPATAA